MPNYYKKRYIKDESFDPIYRSVSPSFFFRSKLLSGALLSVGFAVLGSQVVLPLVFFKTQDEIAQPVTSSVLGVASGFSDFKFQELKQNNEKSVPKDIPEFFYITIPKLRIKDAMVETESSNLSPDTALGHYKGSGLPGQPGNAFIYGHSVLPWFYNPKNYKTIFSTLGDLEVGDEVEVKYNNKAYVYKVESKLVLSPDNVNPLGEFKPKYLNEPTIELMTCWPAGTKAQRLIVRAVMKSE